MDMTFTLMDDAGDPVDVFCEVFARGEGVFWRACLYGFACPLRTLEGRAPLEAAIPGQVQAEIMLRGIRASCCDLSGQ